MTIEPPAGEPMPAHLPVSYYERPLLKKPHWDWNVATYLFLGGIMGGSSSLVVLAPDDDEGATLARNGRYLALGLALACPAFLISHLGRPERFLHMLRIMKFRSPMSLGAWGLFFYGNLAGINAVGQAARDGMIPRWLRFLVPRGLLDPLLALLGSYIAGYTGVLISATAIPLWAKGKSYIPAIFVCSGVSAACATHVALLALEGKNGHVSRKLERLELVASLAELGLLLALEQHEGEIGKPMFQGPRGNKLRNVTILAGIAAPALLNLLPVHARWKTLLASTLTLAGGYTLRETFIEAGKASADDPQRAFRQPE
jgi:formate-dependent nitrite reductase membrane component NrfD